MTDLHELYRERTRGVIAMIDPSARIHDTSTVWHFATILQDVVIGHNCSIGAHSEIGRGTHIGNYTRIGAQCFLPPDSRIGNMVFIGPGVRCADDRHPYVRMKGDDPPYTAEPPVIEDGASVGLGAVLLPGVRIGKNAIVAAGAIVTRDVPDGACVMGRPARLHALSPSSIEGYTRGVVEREA